MMNVDRWIADASVADLIGQMSQIDINMLLEDIDDDKNGGKRLASALAEKFIGELGVGSVLNLPSGQLWTARQYREVMIALNQIAANHNRPPVIWGLDSVHGANYIRNAIVSPQPLNIAATWNITMSEQAGMLASRDTRAAGISWLFSPLLGIALEPKWSRVYETFGEDPVLVGAMAAHMIKGIQTKDTTGGVPVQAAASAKHFVGYSMPRTGHDRSPSWIPRRQLYQSFVPPWQKAMKTFPPMTVMESYTEVDGVPMVENREQLGYLLRQRLGFTGVLVTDYEEIRNLHNWHHTAASENDAVITALRQGTVDMSMIPWDFDSFSNGITVGLEEKRLTLERLQTSAKRVITLKEELGMFNDTVTIVDPNLDLVGTDRHAVLPMVQDSIVLAENKNNLLPLDPNSPLKVHLTGPTANSMAYQSGGWTHQWQGSPDEDWFSYGATVWQSLQKESAWDVSYSCGVDILGKECEDPNEKHPDESVIDQFKHWAGLTPTTSMAMAVEAAKGADVTIICLGEEDATEKPGDIRSLKLPKGQYDLVHAIQRNTDTKIILVFFGGRPRLLSDAGIELLDAVVLGFLPGPDGGPALMDIVSGRVTPSGRLPITYPLMEDGGGVPYFHAVTDQCTNGDENTPLPHYEYVQCPVQWPFGHGLSYTTFEYSDFMAHGGIDDDLEVSVTVTNTGQRTGRDVIMIFTFDKFRRTTPEYKRLRAFDTVTLNAGQSFDVKITVPLSELRFVGADTDRHYILDPKMVSYVGIGYDTDCRKNEEHPLCKKISGNVNLPYAADCEAACNLWRDSQCSDMFHFNNKRCNELCLGVDPLQSQGWGWNYVECLESVVWGFHQDGANFSAADSCWKMTSLCRDVFKTGDLTEYGSGSLLSLTTDDCSAWNSEASVPATVWVAIFTALVTSGIMVLLLRGSISLKKKVRPLDASDKERFDGIQFTSIQSHVLDYE